jgi:hypothetical protein
MVARMMAKVATATLVVRALTMKHEKKQHLLLLLLLLLLLVLLLLLLLLKIWALEMSKMAMQMAVMEHMEHVEHMARMLGCTRLEREGEGLTALLIVIEQRLGQHLEVRGRKRRRN